MPAIPSVSVNRKAEERVRSGHPWIYSSDIASRGEAAPGDVVRVTNERGKVIATAHYSSTSQITLRMLSGKGEPVDRNFFLQRLTAALEFRRKVVQDSEAYRLVHAEGDLLPGLIVDRYGDFLSAQFLDQGMDRSRNVIVDCLQELLSPRGLVARNDVAVRKLEDLDLTNAVIAGEVPGPAHFRMNGLQLEADLLYGQKTGIYLDQRENYVAVARHAHGRALDAFTSTGGFALHMAPRCTSVEAVDSSGDALKTASAIRDVNQIATIEFREANVFDLLSSYSAGKRQFDTVVLDPPAFAKSRKTLDTAIRGYKEINYKALRLLSTGGVLVSCSCSHHLSEAMLLEIIAEAALDAHKTLRVLERRTQAQDHPILLTVPETLYLKCLILQVV